MKRTALDAQIENTQTAADLLAEIARFVEDHGEVAPDNVTWADVGTMAHLAAALQDARDSLPGRSS
jgi:hypothetical protein